MKKFIVTSVNTYKDGGIDMTLNDEKLLNDIKNSIKISKDFRFNDTSIRVKDLEDILDLIHRLQAENERLTEENGYLDMVAKQALTDYQNTQVQVDELKQENSVLSITVELQEEVEKQLVKDTAKEMIEEIDNVKEIFPNDIIGYEQAQGWCMCIDELKEIAKRKGVEVE